MNSLTDQQLLRDYADRQSEAAFAELVRRHIDLVYSAALRMVCDSHLAQDVTQGVFVALAQNARQLTEHPVLSGWLHRTARNLAANTVRSETRRRTREQEAVAMNLLNETENDWETISLYLDDALCHLDEADRDALMLRYFEGKSAREMADILGLREEAAQKRVSRAVERLQEIFSKKRVAVGAGGLAALISANAVQSAPVGLAASVTAAVALAGTTVQTSTIIAATKTIAMTTLQKSIIVGALAMAAGTGIYAAHQNSKLGREIQTLRQQQASLTGQFQGLQQERDDATNRLAALLAENAPPESGSNQLELLRLRGELTRLQNDANDPTSAAAKELVDKVKRLRQRFEQTPGAKIPEMQYLTDHDWLQAANGDLDTDLDYRRAMASLRSTAENEFAAMLQPALNKYMAANNGQFPTDLSQLQPYFASPVDPAILQRWEITSPQTVPNIGVGSQGIVTETAPVDEVFDSRTIVGADGYGNTDYFEDGEIQKLLTGVY
ncbi:MAG TPA: sigma-70 family RNA polymerase sigma factor, partial [Candidatus Acidoferrum sp.]|nr:sigma-70 family RNA polymerase sigma factor [Candidatus Acidoferrum sp.]